jgi:hypothetical protein
MSDNHYWYKGLLFYVLFRLIGPLKSYSLIEVGYSEDAFEDKWMLQWLLSKLKPVLVSSEIQDVYHLLCSFSFLKKKKRTKKLSLFCSFSFLKKLNYVNTFNCPGKKNMVGHSVKFSPMHRSAGHSPHTHTHIKK